MNIMYRFLDVIDLCVTRRVDHQMKEVGQVAITRLRTFELDTEEKHDLTSLLTVFCDYDIFFMFFIM